MEAQNSLVWQGTEESGKRRLVQKSMRYQQERSELIDSKQVSFNNDTSVYAMPTKYASSLNVAPRGLNERKV